METTDVLKALMGQTNMNPVTAAEEAFIRIEEFRPMLLEAVEYAAANPDKIKKTDSDLHLNALFILARARVHEAFAPAMKICRSRAYEQDYLIPHDLKVFYHRILASLFQSNLEPLKEVLEKPRFSFASRDTVLNTLCLLAKKGMISSEETLEYLRSLRNATASVDDAIGVLKNPETETPDQPLHRRDFWELINEFSGVSFLYQWFSYDDSPGDETGMENLEERNTDDSEEIKTYPFNRYRTVPATSTKIGRNDPCTCGSGKKYKKCCGG